VLVGSADILLIIKSCFCVCVSVQASAEHFLIFFVCEHCVEGVQVSAVFGLLLLLVWVVTIKVK